MPFKSVEDRRAYARRRYRERRDLIDDLKSKPCADCGVTYPPYVMDFHHLRDKEFQVPTGWHRQMDVLLKEVEKCVLLCANCHRIRTGPGNGRKRID